MQYASNNKQRSHANAIDFITFNKIISIIKYESRLLFNQQFCVHQLLYETKVLMNELDLKAILFIKLCLMTGISVSLKYLKEPNTSLKLEHFLYFIQLHSSIQFVSSEFSLMFVTVVSIHVLIVSVHKVVELMEMHNQ